MPEWQLWLLVTLCLCALSLIAAGVADLVQRWRRKRTVRHWIESGLTRDEANNLADWSGL